MLRNSKVADRDSWKIIDENISVGELDAKIYDTGKMTSDGVPITGYTYSYEWQTAQQDLTHIQLIVEPVY